MIIGHFEGRVTRARKVAHATDGKRNDRHRVGLGQPVEKADKDSAHGREDRRISRGSAWTADLPTFQNVEQCLRCPCPTWARE